MFGCPHAGSAHSGCNFCGIVTAEMSAAAAASSNTLQPPSTAGTAASVSPPLLSAPPPLTTPQPPSRDGKLRLLRLIMKGHQDDPEQKVQKSTF